MSAAAATPPATPLRRGWVLFTVSMCTMLYSLTVTIANVTLPQLQGALSATPDQVAWIVTLNIVATAVATPMTGWFVARFGARQVMIWSVVGFTISTMLCALATSLGPLLAWRIGQGAFGAPLVPLSQALVVATYAPEERAKAMSIFGMAVVLGPAVGPVLGGYLAEIYNWRWVFGLVVPLCILSLVCVLIFIRTHDERSTSRLDWTGFIALSIAVTCLQLVMDRGERLEWFGSTEIVIMTVVFAWATYTFLVHTFTADKPFISPRLFLDRNFTVGVTLVFIYGMLNFTPIVLLPPLLQNLKGWPDSIIGNMLAMRGAGLVLGFWIAGKMGKLDPRVGLVIGLTLIGYSGYEMMQFDLNAPQWLVAWTGIVQGVGCSVMWVPLSVVTFATLSPKLVPEASAIFHLLRNFGSSIFISISVMTVIRTSQVNYAELTTTISPFNEALDFTATMGGWSIASLGGLAALSGEIGRQSQMIGYSNAFVLYTVSCLVAIPFLALVKIKR